MPYKLPLRRKPFFCMYDQLEYFVEKILKFGRQKG